MYSDKYEILKILDQIKNDINSFYKNHSQYLSAICNYLDKNSKLYDILNSYSNQTKLTEKDITKIIYHITTYIYDIASVRITPLKTPVNTISGIGKKTLIALKKSKIETVEDIFYNFPYKYISYKTDYNYILFEGKFITSEIIFTKYGKRIFQAIFENKKHEKILCVWFNFTKNYPSGILSKDKTYILFGKKTFFNNMLSITHPTFLDVNDVGKIYPIYSLPSEIKNKNYLKFVNEAFNKYLDNVVETLPFYLLKKYEYPDIKSALKKIHFPDNHHEISALENRTHPAIERFIYEELFYLQLGLINHKRILKNTTGIKFDIDLKKLEDLKNYLPFSLTKSQKKVLAEIFSDMSKPFQMNRLVQGDVGSGKTVIAFISGIVAAINGYQVAVIAPTEVLAEQHYNNFQKIFGEKYTAAILTGSLSKKEKELNKEKVKSGEIKFIFGTHAIIQEDVAFANLGFAIIDEQHRFGVLQRKNLIEKGYNPDILLMSATPIPRTLALTFYGDLDISTIDEMPPGRKPIITKAYPESKIESIYEFIENELKKGFKAYFIYPLIDESDKVELKAATASFEQIRSRFGDKVGLLHGKMKADEKRDILNKFKNGEISILVSTTVIEVGVDVPDATIMVIENAERFGLSQLHQLRGRVGRSNFQSYCILIYSKNISEEGKKRINAMVSYSNGFKIAEIDLEIRGPGDFFGTKQSGLPDFKFSNIVRDVKILKNARSDAEEIIKKDPFLSDPKHKVLKEVLFHKWKNSIDLIKVG